VLGIVIACDPNGPGVYAAWEAGLVSGLTAIGFSRSLDNGATWTPGVNLTPTFHEVLPAYGFDRYNSFPSLAVNPIDHGVELTYAASLDGTPASDFGDVIYRRSTDQGVTFSAPAAIDPFAGADRPQIFPTISAAADGRIDAYWYDQSAGSGTS